MDLIEEAIASARSPEIAGYHELRARRAGRARYIDLHLQFRSGTSLEEAHSLAHTVRDAIVARFPTAQVLIHVEPETSLRHDKGSLGPYRAG
jgi:divalent metal cation (Fe/Co/Zn/Cd) transporter